MSPSDYLRNYFFLASGELVTLSGLDMMNMVINNMSLMNRNSEGFAIFTNVYEGIYMLYAELDALVEYLGAGNYDAATYGELMQAAIDARNDMNEVLIKGDKRDADPAKRYILYTHSEPGTADVSGNFQPATTGA